MENIHVSFVYVIHCTSGCFLHCAFGCLSAESGCLLHSDTYLYTQTNTSPLFGLPLPLHTLTHHTNYICILISYATHTPAPTHSLLSLTHTHSHTMHISNRWVVTQHTEQQLVNFINRLKMKHLKDEPIQVPSLSRSCSAFALFVRMCLCVVKCTHDEYMTFRFGRAAARVSGPDAAVHNVLTNQLRGNFIH